VKDVIGMPMKDLSKEIDKLGLSRDLAGRLAATKAAALIGTVGVAVGLEYMIQHTKNIITAKGFNTKNFAAVAGLEQSQAHTKKGLTDPVAKAKKRAKQVAALVAGALGLSVFTPLLLRKNPALLLKTEKFLKVVDCKKNFDISKPILAFIIGSGVVSYLDASRDSLELKENASRLAVVVPYLLGGRELAKCLIAKSLEKFAKIEVGKQGWKPVKKPLGELVRLVEDNPFRKMCRKESLLETDVVIDKTSLTHKLHSLPFVQDLQKQNKALLAEEVKAAILQKHNIYVQWGSFALSALGCGTLLNWILYRQTQARYKHQQELSQTPAAAQIPSGEAWHSTQAP